MTDRLQRSLLGRSRYGEHGQGPGLLTRALFAVRPRRRGVPAANADASRGRGSAQRRGAFGLVPSGPKAPAPRIHCG